MFLISGRGVLKSDSTAQLTWSPEIYEILKVAELQKKGLRKSICISFLITFPFAGRCSLQSSCSTCSINQVTKMN